jgi:hypothetical protein
MQRRRCIPKQKAYCYPETRGRRAESTVNIGLKRGGHNGEGGGGWGERDDMGEDAGVKGNDQRKECRI